MSKLYKTVAHKQLCSLTIKREEHSTKGNAKSVGAQSNV